MTTWEGAEKAWNEGTLKEKEEYTALTKQSVSDWIFDTFGERCDEFEETCIVRQKWKLFDQLFEGLE